MTGAPTTGSPAGDAETALPAPADRVLLVYPPVYDTRLNWAQWQQPSLLLRLARHLRAAGSDVRLIDAVAHRPRERLRRSRVEILDADGQRVHRWRFGPTAAAIAAELRALAKAGWQPDLVYVECQVTPWWEGVAEVVRLVRQRFPAARVVAVGAYARLAPAHARAHAGVDDLLPGLPARIARLAADLTVYPHVPTHALVSLGADREPEDLVEEVRAKAAKRVHHFAIADHAPASRCRDRFREVLAALRDARLGLNFYALGNIAASDLVDQPDLAELMRAAGYVQICFADDRDQPMTAACDEQIVAAYRVAAERCRAAGFVPRTDALVGGICVGRRGEDLESRARLMTRITGAVGSVIVWPYQPTPAECLRDLPLQLQNGKLFPLRAENGLTYGDYMGLVGLSAILNAKHRDVTFDFLGDGLIPRLFRDSIARSGWEPPSEVKGTMQLPVLVGR
ncbi:MAG TPA: radical SAM protein [Chloroflexota bacterium]|nr:radical SAM protein [Chloroflexota bacterium]